MVELEAQPQQQPALEDAGRQVRVVRLAADRAEQDGVVLPDLGEHGVGQHLTGGEVALGAQVVAGLLELDLGRRRDLEHLQRLGGHLGTDAVAGDDREPREMSWAQTLVVVGALAAVVPQVERRLDGGVGVLGAARVLGVVAGRAPVGIHVVHRYCLLVIVLI